MKSRVSMPEQLSREFKRRIAAGVYPVNSFLPPERELSREFDTSRDTVAAALAILTDQGLTERCRGRGTRVLHWQESQSQLPLCIIHGPLKASRESFLAFEAIHDVLSRRGHRYELVGAEKWDSISEGEWPPVSTDQIMDRFGGAIYLESIYCNQQILELKSQDFPVVVANLEDDMDISCTWVNHSKTTAHAVRTLAGLGHRRIAYLGRGPGPHFYGKAITGYLAGLEEVDIDPDESLLGTVDQSRALPAYLKTRELLALPNPPTAIVAARDLFAEGACQAAQEVGLVIGRDISIIGYDDVTWPQPEPFLTTFREPCYEMGVLAAELFLEKVITSNTEVIKREIDSPFIIRRSAGPLI